jgi:hypothetical protein
MNYHGLLAELGPSTVARFLILGNGLIRYRLSELEKWRASRPAHHIVALEGKNKRRLAGVRSTILGRARDPL